MAWPPIDPLGTRMVHWLLHRRGRLCLGLGLLGLALWLWLYEDYRTVAIQLPQSGAELIYARVETDLVAYNSYRAFAITGVIPLTRIHPNIGGVRHFCVAEGRHRDGGHPLVMVSDHWGTIWFDLEHQCVDDTYKPTRIEPADRICPGRPPFPATWQQVGKITNASWDEPIFVPGAFEECTDESVKQHR